MLHVGARELTRIEIFTFAAWCEQTGSGGLLTRLVHTDVLTCQMHGLCALVSRRVAEQEEGPGLKICP